MAFFLKEINENDALPNACRESLLKPCVWQSGWNHQGFEPTLACGKLETLDKVSKGRHRVLVLNLQLYVTNGEKYMTLSHSCQNGSLTEMLFNHNKSRRDWPCPGATNPLKGVCGPSKLPKAPRPFSLGCALLVASGSPRWHVELLSRGPWLGTP